MFLDALAAGGRRAMAVVGGGVLVAGGLLVAVSAVGPRAGAVPADAATGLALSISPSAGAVGTVVTVTGYAPGDCQGIMFAPDVADPGGDVLFPAGMVDQPGAFSASVVIPAYVGGATLEPPDGAHRVGHVVTPGTYVFQLACNQTSGPPITITDTFDVESAAVPSGRFVGMVATPEGQGYWLAQAGGGVYSYGDAPFEGSLPGDGVTPAAPIAGIAATPDGRGYWLVGADGGVFAFGDASYFGSYPASVAQSADLDAGHVVGLVPSADGQGYTEVFVNGSTTSWGDAELSSAGLRSDTFTVAMALTTGGTWTAGTDGGVFTTGDAPFEGSLPGDGVTPDAPIDDIVGTPGGSGYWLLGADGGVFSFGQAAFYGSAPGLEVLPPATVAPVSVECTLPLTHEEDGNVTPLICPDGGVNVAAWQHYAEGYVDSKPLAWSKTMSLGRDATSVEVESAMCSDYADIYGTNPLTISSGTLAAAYYGWNASVMATIRGFLAQNCSTGS